MLFIFLQLNTKVNLYMLHAGGGAGSGGLWASVDELLTVLGSHDGELARQWRALLHDINGNICA